MENKKTKTNSISLEVEKFNKQQYVFKKRIIKITNHFVQRCHQRLKMTAQKVIQGLGEDYRCKDEEGNLLYQYKNTDFYAVVAAGEKSKYIYFVTITNQNVKQRLNKALV